MGKIVGADLLTLISRVREFVYVCHRMGLRIVTTFVMRHSLCLKLYPRSTNSAKISVLCVSTFLCIYMCSSMNLSDHIALCFAGGAF